MPLLGLISTEGTSEIDLKIDVYFVENWSLFSNDWFTFRKLEFVSLQNRSLKIGVCFRKSEFHLNSGAKLCAFFSHVGSTKDEKFGGFIGKLLSTQSFIFDSFTK